jgi:His-Xaa-Ser repeat protein HxsA
MSVTLFALQTLAAAGLQSPPESLPTTSPALEPAQTNQERQFRLQREFTLAAHRSHSSHRSHASHRSSYEGHSGTSDATPAAPQTNRNTDSTPPHSVLPSSPSIAPTTNSPPPASRTAAIDPSSSKLTALRGNSAQFTALVKKVQLALFARGYYTGPVDGKMNNECKVAISRAEKAFRLPPSGTLSDGLLDALNISL